MIILLFSLALAPFLYGFYLTMDLSLATARLEEARRYDRPYERWNVMNMNRGLRNFM